MDKAELRQCIIKQLEQALDSALAATRRAHQSATHEDSIAENKYDTRGLEAAYLAHGLSVRAQQLLQAISHYRQLPSAAFDNHDRIQLNCLVTLENDDGQRRQVFLGEQAGGLKITGADAELTVITPTSPLGRVLLDKQHEDEVSLHINGQRNHYLICAIE